MTGFSNDYSVYAGNERREVLPFVPADAARILDVGCSTGNFAALLKQERGAEVWGLEPDERAAEIAAEKIDRVVASDFLTAAELPGRHFDCIVFNDVLEHMVDPHSALVRAGRLIAPHGAVVASIPNVRYFGNVYSLLVRKDWEYVDSGILDRTHLRFFTEKSISRLFLNAGFGIGSITGINPIRGSGSRLGYAFTVLNLLTLGSIADMNWLQFVVVARIREPEADAT